MAWCDTSSIDWEAVGAIGTWAVGLAAVVVAFKANALAAAIRTVESERNIGAARAMVGALRIEALHYGLRLKRLAAVLSEIGRTLDDRAAARVANAYERAARADFADFGNRAALLPYLPQELAAEIATLYSLLLTNRIAFNNTAEIMRELQEIECRPENISELIATGAEKAHDAARGAFQTLSRMTSYLGYPLDPDYLSMD